MKKIKPIAFSFVVSLSIAFLFLIITFWIFYEYSGSRVSANDALSTAGSYFGAVSTLGTAIIAAHLFNDWRVQHNKEVRNKFALHVYDQFITLNNSILDYGFHIEGLKIPKKKLHFAFLKSKDDERYLIQISELYHKQDKINIDISYFLDRLREYGVIIGQSAKISVYMENYIKYFSKINENKLAEVDSLEGCKIVFSQTYDNYNLLRDKINSEIIINLLENLQANPESALT